jgi:hypothetical protein
MNHKSTSKLNVYFVRREAWHVLEHVWEIEDRLEEPGA